MLDVSRVACCCHRRRDCRDRSHRHRDRQLEAKNEHRGPRKKQADEATSTLLARSTEENSTKSQNGTSSNLRTCQTNSSNNRSTDEGQTVSESTGTEQVSLPARSPTSPRPPHPRNFWSQAFSTLPSNPGYSPGVPSLCCFPRGHDPENAENVAANNAKTSSS